MPDITTPNRFALSIVVPVYFSSATLGPLLARLRAAANEAQSAMAAAQGLLSSNGGVQKQPETTSIGNAMYELSRAAQSLRSLADYLDRHPEALLRGKG